MRYNGHAHAHEPRAAGVIGPQASIGKLYWTSWHRQFGETAMDVLGAEANVRRGQRRRRRYELDELHQIFMASHAETIYAGSSEIQRNIIGERVLGLPREPKPQMTGDTVNFAFSEEQEELRRTVRQFLEAKSPETEVRRLMETVEGYDPAVWKQMGQELGLQSLAIPEEFGGQGFTFIELGIVLEEMGRVLLCAPYFSSVVLAANAILNVGTEDQKQALLPGIASGDTIATLAFTEPNGQVGRPGITMEAPRARAAASRSRARRCSCSTASPPTSSSSSRAWPVRPVPTASRSSRCEATPTDSPARRCRRWT